MLYAPGARALRSTRRTFRCYRHRRCRAELHFNVVHQAFVERKSQGGQRREEGLSDSSGASLVYAGYPYDPYA
jgi:hypothetical protein